MGKYSKCGQILSQPTVQRILSLHDNILQTVFLKPQHQLNESVTN